MAMNVNDAAAGASNGQVQGRDGAASKGEPMRGFLEVFRRLPEDRFNTTASGLKVATIREGEGAPMKAGMKVKVHYTGWLVDGTKFDSSAAHGKPFEFTLGGGRVIKGWEEGLTGMKPGERRQLVIPPNLGYGSRKMGDIPPGATLIFNVEALAVDEASPNTKGTMTVVA